jgi:hypothetical protein
MQRTYSMFPLGAPGIGLVLLRLCLAASLWPLLGTALCSPPGGVVFWGVIGVALALLLGLLTPVACGLCIILAGIEAIAPAHPLFAHILPLALNAAALVLLGPGAYSVDARLYGHRVLTLPDER